MFQLGKMYLLRSSILLFAFISIHQNKGGYQCTNSQKRRATHFFPPKRRPPPEAPEASGRRAEGGRSPGAAAGGPAPLCSAQPSHSAVPDGWRAGFAIGDSLVPGLMGETSDSGLLNWTSSNPKTNPLDTRPRKPLLSQSKLADPGHIKIGFGIRGTPFYRRVDSTDPPEGLSFGRTASAAPSPANLERTAASSSLGPLSSALR